MIYAQSLTRGAQKITRCLFALVCFLPRICARNWQKRRASRAPGASDKAAWRAVYVYLRCGSLSLRAARRAIVHRIIFRWRQRAAVSAMVCAPADNQRAWTRERRQRRREPSARMGAASSGAMQRLRRAGHRHGNSAERAIGRVVGERAGTAGGSSGGGGQRSKKRFFQAAAAAHQRRVFLGGLEPPRGFMNLENALPHITTHRAGAGVLRQRA